MTAKGKVLYFFLSLLPAALLQENACEECVTINNATGQDPKLSGYYRQYFCKPLSSLPQYKILG